MDLVGDGITVGGLGGMMDMKKRMDIGMTRSLFLLRPMNLTQLIRLFVLKSFRRGSRR